MAQILGTGALKIERNRLSLLSAETIVQFVSRLFPK